MDAFAPPADPTGPSARTPAGEIDVGAAVRTGFGALVGNLAHLIGVGVILIVVYIVSVCSCVLWIATLPWMMWGGMRWILSALDGASDLSKLWSAVQEDPMTAWIRGWGFLGVSFVVMLPLIAVGVGLAFAQQGSTPEMAAAWTLGSTLISASYTALIARFQLAWWYIVERRDGVMGSIERAWSDARSAAVPLALLTGAVTLANAPFQAANAYLGAWFQAMPPGQQLESMPMLYLGLFALSIPASLLGAVLMFAQGACYRQLYPTAPEVQV